MLAQPEALSEVRFVDAVHDSPGQAVAADAARGRADATPSAARHARARRPAPPPVAYIKVSGGIFRDMMIHDFDMANFLMNAAPVSVQATGSSIVDPAIGAAGDVDTAVVTLTYAGGVALAAFAGVLAAPILQVSALMGSNLIIVVFAVVVIGGMGSILGSIVTGLGLGLIEGLTKVFYPEASSTVVFVVMALVLLVRPAGLFGKEK